MWSLSKKGETFPIHYFLYNQSQFKIPKGFKENNLGQGIPEHLLVKKCVLKQTATTRCAPMHSMCSEQLIIRPITKLCCSDAVAAVWWGLQDHNFAPKSSKLYLALCWVVNSVLNCCCVQTQLVVRRLSREAHQLRAAPKPTDFKLFDMLFSRDKMGKKWLSAVSQLLF